jgi:hypothetical protein
MRWAFVPVLVLVLMSVAMGCTNSPAETPAPIGSFSTLFMELLANESSFKLLVDPGRSGHEPCAVLLDDAAARLGPLDIPLGEPGLWTGEDEEGTTQCHLPLFAASVPPPEVASTLEIHDRSGTIECSVPGARLVRQDAPPSALPWQLRAGQPVMMTWPVSADHRLCTVALASAGPTPVPTVSYEDLGNGVMRFTVPPVVPGQYTLDLLLFGIPLSCIGGSLAAPVTATFSFQQSITVVDGS